MRYNKLKIAMEIENLLPHTEDGTYMEAVCMYCEIHDLDESNAKKFLSDTLIQKLEREASSRKLIVSEQTEVNIFNIG